MRWLGWCLLGLVMGMAPAGAEDPAAAHPRKATATAQAAARKAETDGDLSAARRAWDEAARQAMRIPNRALAIQCKQARVAVERRREVPADLAQSLRTLAVLLDGAGRSDEALAAAQEALETYRRASDRRGEALALGTLALAQHHAHEHEAALATNAAARALMEELGEQRHAARLMGNSGAMHNRLGQHRKAIALLRLSLQRREELGDELGAVTAVTGIAQAHYFLRERTLSRSLYEQAWKRAAGIEDDHAKLAIQSGLGLLASDRKEWAQALEHHRLALVHADRIESRRDQLGMRVNMVEFLLKLDRAEEAQALLETSRKYALGFGNLQGAARLHEVQARIHESNNDYGKAIAVLQMALLAYRMSKDEPGQIRALLTRADLRQIVARRGFHDSRALDMEKRRTDLAPAKADAEQALALARERDDALAISKAVTALANIRVDLMDHEGVLALVDEAIAVEPRLASRRSHEELIQAKGSTTELYHIGFFSAAASLDMTRAWNLLERGRGRTLLDQLTNRDEIRTRKIPQALRDAEIEARAAERSTRARVHAARRSRSRARIRKAKAAYEAAIAHTATVVADIQRAQRRTGALLHPRPADLATVRRGLDARTAILSLSVMPLRGSIAVLTTTKQVRVVSVWTDAEQQTGVRAFTEAADDETMFERMAETVAELQARLELPEGIERLLVSPDGALAYVPWSLVFPKHEVTIIPSATIWQLLEESAAERGEGVFALGNPEYGAAASRRRGAAASRAGSHWARLVPLPATGVEARAVGSVVLLGEQATEAGVRARLAESKRWRSIHFACHGLIDAAHPLLSCLAVTAAAPDDGFLTAAEVFTLDARADLVVLSACETGRGDAWYGEGVVGLTQAFLFAGAPRVLCSLWKVDDEATRYLMTRFYALWNPAAPAEGLPAAAALRQAQAEVRAKPAWKHPRYWAAWVLWGRHD